MKAYELRGHSLDQLTLTERSDPPAPGDREVQVRVRAASLNYRDYAIATGRYQTGLPLPFVPASDGAGEVVAVGRGVTQFKVGDRVIGHYTTAWLSGAFDERYHASKLGGPLDGMLREQVTLPENAWVPAPSHLTDAEAATLPIAALTAWTSLEDLALPPGAWLLVQGTGSVSLFALQFARLRGLRVLATTTRAEKARILQELGAEQVIVTAQDPQWGAIAYRLADGRGVDGAIDVGGAVTLPDTLAALRGNGAIALVGFLGGFGPTQDLTLPILAKRARLLGQSVGSRDAFLAMNRAVAAHALKPVIDRAFPLVAVRDAYAHVGSGRAAGKTVITFD